MTSDRTGFTGERDEQLYRNDAHREWTHRSEGIVAFTSVIWKPVDVGCVFGTSRSARAGRGAYRDAEGGVG